MRSDLDRKIICSQPDNGFINLLLQTMTQQYISTFCKRDKTPVNTLKSEKCTKHSKIEKKNKKSKKKIEFLKNLTKSQISLEAISN